MATLFATVVPWLLFGVGTLLWCQLARQNGRILLRLESIEQNLAVRDTSSSRRKSAGLSVGTYAPDFELPDLAGARRKLSEFHSRDVLLIFFNPKCGFCTRMAADLAALPPHGDDGRATPVVITTGDAN